MKSILYITFINLLTINLFQFSQSYNRKIGIRLLDETNNTKDSNDKKNEIHNSAESSNITHLPKASKETESNSTIIHTIKEPEYMEILILGAIVQNKANNNFNFLIYVAFNEGYFDSTELKISSGLKYKEDTKINKEEKICPLSKSKNQISEYNCNFDLNSSKHLESLEIYDDIKINDFKPNKAYLSTSANYTMADLVNNVDKLDFESFLNNGFKYAKNAHIVKMAGNSFTIEMDLDISLGLTAFGTFPTIDNKMVMGLCSITQKQNQKSQMECFMYSDFKSHFNNSILYATDKITDNVIIVFNENENDLIETKKNKSNENNLEPEITVPHSTPSSSSSKTTIIVLACVFGSIGLIAITKYSRI